MAETTAISWTDATFNPWIGCAHVHAGCTHCYAEALAKRYGKAKWGVNGTRSRTSDNYWKQPLTWNRKAGERFDHIGDSMFASSENLREQSSRQRVFCASLADVFEDWQGPIVDSKSRPLLCCDHNGCIAGGWHGNRDYLTEGTHCGLCFRDLRPATMSNLRADLFRVIDQTPNLDWLLLTKRPENVRRMWPPRFRDKEREENNLPAAQRYQVPAARRAGMGWYRDNVWLVYSASDQPTLEAGLPHLLACRDLVPVLGLSLEPLLGPVNLGLKIYCGRCNPLISEGHPVLGKKEGWHGVDWVITGCESGPHRRPWNIEWDLAIQNQCIAAGVWFFRKQIILDGRVSTDPSEWDLPLRCQQFPAPQASGV